MQETASPAVGLDQPCPLSITEKVDFREYNAGA